MKFLGAIAMVVGIAACGRSAPPAPAATAATPARRDVELPGDANGLYWDAADHALYLTDATQEALVKWTDDGGITSVAALSTAPKVDFGGITRASDGAFVIASFGFGTDGAVFTAQAGRPAGVVPALDPKRRRIGVTRASDGTLYDAYFVVDGHVHTGGVAKLDLARGETDVVTAGLTKPVGIAATAAGVFVADQASATVFAVEPGGTLRPLAANLPGTDLLAALPDGSLVTGGKTGAITRIAPDGTATQLAAGFEQVRGLAYDPAGKRLFVVDHGKAKGSRVLHILPRPL